MGFDHEGAYIVFQREYHGRRLSKGILVSFASAGLVIQEQRTIKDRYLPEYGRR